MRVVALTCSNTEIVCALGCGDQLVGVDDHSDYPLEVIGALPRVGPDLTIDVEKVRALEPDLVLASLTVPGHERVVERLERAQLRYLALEPIVLSDVYENVRVIARELGVPDRAERLIAAMRAELAPASELGPSVLIEWWPKPVIVPGERSWLNDVLASAGARNPFATRACKSTPITDEEALAADPDAIVIAWCGVRLEKYRPDVVYRRPAWQGLRALRERRVYCVPEAHLGRPGPRLVEGARDLRRIADAVRGATR